MSIAIISVLMFLTQKLNAQLKWDIISGDNLNPQVFSFKGDVLVNAGNKVAQVSPTNRELIIDLKQKSVYIVSNDNSFIISGKSLKGIKLDDYPIFSEEVLFNDDFNNSIKELYRINLYEKLNLNQIEFSSSKKMQYELDDKGDLFLKNQKKTIGKVCAIGNNFIQILDNTGRLDIYKDGDFNYLTIGQLKAYNCQTLYDYVYEDFKLTLSNKIKKWENNIIQQPLDSLLNIFGTVGNVQNLTTDRKIITWKKEVPIYEVGLSTLTNRSSYSSNLINGIANISSTFNLNNYSPLFIYGNEYRNVDLSSYSSSLSTSNTSSFQQGNIIRRDAGYSISIIVDNSNKITRVLHNNVFSDLKYGQPFRFVN